MNLFKTINTTINKPSYDISIKNIDASNIHWGSEKSIISALDEIENLYIDKENFNKKIVLFALDMKKYNQRIEDIKFYRIPEQNKLIILAITNVKKFKDVVPFKREMNITLKKQGNFSFSIIELLEDENKALKKEEKGVPENWQLDEALTARFNKLKGYSW